MIDMELRSEKSFIKKIQFGEKREDGKIRTTFFMGGKPYVYDISQETKEALVTAHTRGESLSSIYNQRVKGTGHPEPEKFTI